MKIRKYKPIWKGTREWYKRKYQPRYPRNIGGDKHSASHPLIAECMSNYETEQEILKEKQETDRLIKECKSKQFNPEYY